MWGGGKQNKKFTDCFALCGMSCFINSAIMLSSLSDAGKV